MLDQLLDAIIAVIESGEVIPDDLAEELAILIQELLSEEGRITGGPQLPPQPPPVPPVPSGEHESSNINGFKYDPKTQELYIQFHGPYPQAEGPVYSYQGVPEYIFEVLRRGAVGPRTSGRNRYHAWHQGVTPSLGAAVAALIKRAPYPYRRVA